ncbi:hypothetical protein K4F52_009655 [Lecanicillium sp. MT-2017a]|nr:hypothetical protein K4F52_009655 [Lecanicillium sp. MT-2017a]
MDVAYNQHADRARRKNRSSTNINHLSLAPLTAKLPLNDPDSFADHSSSGPAPSYLQGKSAPTTPRFLGHTPATPRSRSHQRTPSAPSGGSISTSKSTTQLGGSRSRSNGRRPGSGATTPKRRGHRDGETLGSRHKNDSDWMLRTAAMMSSEARESKGQAWLVSRQSSTSLSGMRDADEDAFENEIAREREMSRRGSTADDDASPYPSRRHSRFNSRRQSIAESRSQGLTPLDRPGPAGSDSYFPAEDAITGPDFVNLDQKLEELEQDTELEDEAAIRRLMREGQRLKGSWISNFIGWSLFAVDERGEDSDSDDDDYDEEDDEATPQGGRGAQTPRHFEGITNMPAERIAPPKKADGGWNDAAWLLSVATKVMF